MTRKNFLFPHQRWVDDLEFASCLLPAATGSSASKSLIRIFIFSFGILFFRYTYRRDDGENEKALKSM